MPTDFQNYFTVTLGCKFASKLSVKIPPRLELFATLPCKMFCGGVYFSRICGLVCTYLLLLTHSYVIDHTDLPGCTNCNRLLSVKHILTECSFCNQTWQQYY